MIADFLARSSEEVRALSAGTRARRIVLVFLCAACLVIGFGYTLLIWNRGEPAAAFIEGLSSGIILAGYLFLWVLLSHLFRERPSTPAKVFWTILLAGLLVLALGWLILSIGSPPAQVPSAESITRGFEYGTGVPLTLTTVFQMNLLGFLEASFAFLLLLRLRGLVLFKRTKSSQRNWYLMLAFMTLAALLTFMRPARLDPGPLAYVATIPAVAYMVVNSFRLSWILFLSFREKMALMGLSVLLLGLLAVTIPAEGAGLLADAVGYLHHYSYPLSFFMLLAWVFGILYTTTAFLSLLFHLPTTGDFQQKASEMAAMHSLTTLVSQVFDLEKLVYSIAASPVEAGSARAAWLAVPDPQSGSMRPRIVATHSIAPTDVEARVDTAALYEEVNQLREPLLLEQAPADHRISVKPGEGLGSLLVMPLLARDEMLGALFVTKEVSHGFEKDDIEAMSIFAAQAALAFDNARLFEEQLEKERMARELSIAHEVQRKLLPQCLPYLDGVAICASSVPAQEVGGDYYDFSQLDDDRLAIIIADVSGKGTSAAFYMAELQGIFRSLSRLTPSPAVFLDHANEALAASLERHVFISVIYGFLDLEKEEFILARAGHCPAALISLNGEARFLRSRGLGLGLDRGGLFRQALTEERIRLQPGDVFVLYTDGIVESRNAAGEEYGYERLLHSLREHRHEEAAVLHDHILSDLQRFLGHKEYDDDMTLVVLKWHGIGLQRSPEGRAGAQKNIPIEATVLD